MTRQLQIVGALALVKVLSDWLMRNHRRRLKLRKGDDELELSGGHSVLHPVAVKAWAEGLKKSGDAG